MLASMLVATSLPSRYSVSWVCEYIGTRQTHLVSRRVRYSRRKAWTITWWSTRRHEKIHRDVFFFFFFHVTSIKGIWGQRSMRFRRLLHRSPLVAWAMDAPAPSNSPKETLQMRKPAAGIRKDPESGAESDSGETGTSFNFLFLQGSKLYHVRYFFFHHRNDWYSVTITHSKDGCLRLW